MIPLFLERPSARPGYRQGTTLLAIVLGLGITAPVSRAADSKPSGSTIDVTVSGQGIPVPGVKITLAPDKGGPPESWNARDSTPIGVMTTDATGHARFADVPAGKYIVTGNCGLPGNWIAGNYATRLETLAGRPAHVTLTVRGGAMARGVAVQGDRPAGHAKIRTESPDAMASTCGTMTTSLVDSVTGAFTVSKIPIGATTWVKGNLDLGPGQIEVWKDFHFEKPETLEVKLEFPPISEGDVGTLVLDLKADGAEKPDSGSAQLLQVKGDGSWRYEATVGVGGAGGAKTYSHLPAGPYQIRAHAEPGANKWWSSPIDSLRIVPGKTTRYTVAAKLRS